MCNFVLDDSMSYNNEKRGRRTSTKECIVENLYGNERRQELPSVALWTIIDYTNFGKCYNVFLAHSSVSNSNNFSHKYFLSLKLSKLYNLRLNNHFFSFINYLAKLFVVLDSIKYYMN